MRAWRLANPEKRRAQDRAWQLANPEKVRISYHRRRSIRRSLVADLTPQQWAAILTSFKGRCAYCGRKGKLTQDHVVPVSLGGAYSIGNIVPACPSCNSSKGAKEAPVAVQALML